MQVTDKITITNECNMQMMSRYPNNYFDLAIVDPPYGIGIEQRIFKDYKEWDSTPPNEDYFKELFRVSKNQIILGGNYFIDKLYPTKCFLIWDKKITESHTFSMAEFAWTSFNSNSKCFYQPPPGHRGFYKIDGERIHPTQKGIDLYKWQLSLYAKKDFKILDTHFGSGSIAIACHDYGFELVACELDKDYYKSSIKRVKTHIGQTQLFL